jgi:FkbM family methyltransferase
LKLLFILTTLQRLVENTLRLIRSPKMALYYAKWQSVRFFRSRPPVATFFGSIRFGHFASFSEYWRRHRGIDSAELQLFEAVFECCEKPAIAFDVGANLGLYSLAMARIGFENIHAFEPIPATYERLVSNLQRNPTLARRVTANAMGAGKTAGAQSFILYAASPGKNKLLGSNQANNGIDIAECPVTTLDSYIAANRIGAVALAKIDVEGFELEVLRGMSHAIRQGQIQFIYLEIIPRQLEAAGGSLTDLLTFLSTSGFEPVHLDLQRRLIPSSFEKALQRSGDICNTLFRFKPVK